MRLSTRGEYGLRAMLDLAQHFGQGTVTLRSIAGRQDISEYYLEQLVAQLRKAKLVTSVRGAHGGYMLARTPGEIRVGDVIRVLEGPIAPTDCVSGAEESACARAGTCGARVVWEKIKDSMEEVLDSITLEDLCVGNTSVEISAGDA